MSRLNLKDTVSCIKAEHPVLAIGFSKFAELPSTNVVLPGICDVHNVCIILCPIHHNAKQAHAAKLSNTSGFCTTVEDCMGISSVLSYTE